MRLPNRLFPALLSLGACLCLTPGIAMAQRGGGGHGGGMGGGGMRGGGGMMGGGMRGGGFGGGGFRGGGFGGGFRGGFVGGNRFRGGFINRGIGFNRGFGFGGGFWPWWGWGWGGGWWPGWSSWDSGYAAPVDYGYPAYSDASAYPAYAGYPQQAPQQPAQNITVIYPPQQAVSPIIRQYDEYGQEMRSAGPGPAATYSAPAYSAPAAPSTAAAPVYLIAFKDHEIWAVSAYWLTGTTLHFVTLEHQERQAAMDTVDRDLSNRLNRERHVTFSLDR